MQSLQTESKESNIFQKRVIYLTFHKLIPNISYSVNNFSPARFSQFLKYISSFDEDRIVITFDDGYAHLRDRLPELMQRFHFTPIIFVPTKLIGKKATWDYSYHLRKLKHLDRCAIRELSEIGVKFGSHGDSHVDLTSLTKKLLKAELNNSKAILEDLTGKNVTKISYPFGRQNKIVRIIASEFGFKTGFTMNFPNVTDHPLAHGRIPVYGFDNNFSIKQKVNNGRLYQLEKLKAGITSYLSGGTVLLNRIRKYQA